MTEIQNIIITPKVTLLNIMVVNQQILTVLFDQQTGASASITHLQLLGIWRNLSSVGYLKNSECDKRVPMKY